MLVRLPLGRDWWSSFFLLERSPVAPLNVDGIERMSFQAKYNSLCEPCGEEINLGDFIVGHPDAGYVHEECVEDVGKIFDKPSKLPCDRCFMVHGNGQEFCE